MTPPVGAEPKIAHLLGYLPLKPPIMGLIHGPQYRLIYEIGSFIYAMPLIAFGSVVLRHFLDQISCYVSMNLN